MPESKPTTIADVHRAETISYVLGHLREAHESETARVAIYASQPYAAALESIAHDRAFRLEQLIRAIEAGLYDRLDAADAEMAILTATVEYVDYDEIAAVREIEREMAIEAGDDSELDRQVAEDDARAEREYEVHVASEAWLDAHPDDYVNDADEAKQSADHDPRSCTECVDQYEAEQAEDAELAAREAERDADGRDTAWSTADQIEHDQACEARIDAAIDALLALRNLAAERPDIADAIAIGKYGSTKMNFFVGNSKYQLPERHISDVSARIAELAEAAARHGAVLRPDNGPDYGGVRATFGPFELYIYAPLEQVGTSAVREVTEWQLDPRLTALGTEASR